MQICRFCGKLIPTETRYDPWELCICKTCEEEHRKQNEKVAEMILEAMNNEVPTLYNRHGLGDGLT